MDCGRELLFHFSGNGYNLILDVAPQTLCIGFDGIPALHNPVLHMRHGLRSIILDTAPGILDKIFHICRNIRNRIFDAAPSLMGEIL